MTVQFDLVGTYLLQKPKYASNLVEWVGSDYALDVYLYGAGEYDILFSILEKAQKYMDEAEKAHIVSSSLMRHTYTDQADDLLYRYNWVIMLLISAVAVLGLVRILRRKTRKAEEQARENEQLQQRLWLDDKTTLYNREGFFANAREMFARLGGDVAIVRVNICRFKQFNEVYGLENGDMILRDVGSHLKQLEAQAPLVLGRFAADSFYLCVANSNLEKLSFLRQISVPALSLVLNLDRKSVV